MEEHVFDMQFCWRPCSLGTCPWEEKPQRDSSALCWDVKPQVLQQVERYQSTLCRSWRSWGSPTRKAQHQAPVSHSDLPAGRAAVWSGQGWVDPRRSKAPVQWALPFFFLPPICKKGARTGISSPFSWGLARLFPAPGISSWAPIPVLGSLPWGQSLELPQVELT